MGVDSNLAGGEFGPLAESGIPRDGDFESSFLKLGSTGAVANDISALGESSDVTAPTLPVATPTNTVDEVQKVAFGGATGGTFRLRYKEKVSADIAYNVTSVSLQATLRALHDDLAAVTVADTDAGATRSITFVGAAVEGDLPMLVVDTDDTTGGTGVVITQTTAGALGSVSIAYTEDAGGVSVLASVINDDTGEKFDVQVDAATPVVHDGLRSGAYTAALRTVTSAGRVSKPLTVTFSIT